VVSRSHRAGIANTPFVPLCVPPLLSMAPSGQRVWVADGMAAGTALVVANAVPTRTRLAGREWGHQSGTTMARSGRCPNRGDGQPAVDAIVEDDTTGGV